MRNLKRALSLGLASSMVLGTMAFGVSASQLEKFNDADKITNEKAVGIVNQVGLMLGDDEGNFNPGEAVTRAEMAVICTTMLNGAGFHASQFVGTNVFNDVPEWCQDYVNLAASLGIVAGRGDGVFAPNDTVTTAEAMLMILKTLGYYDKDDSRLNDELMANWQLSATRQGTELSLYNPEVDGDLAADQPLTRENVASICFRALTDVVHVDYNPNQTAYYNYGNSMVDGVNNNATEDTLGYKNFLKLHAADDIDVFNRPATSWMYNGTEIDVYTNDATETYTTAITGRDLYTLIGSSTLNNEDFTRGIYVNGELLEEGYVMDSFDENGKRVILDVDTSTVEGFNSFISNSDTTTWLETGNGVKTEVFIIAPEYTTSNGVRYKTKDGQIVISMVHTYIATVEDAEDLGDGLFKYYVDFPQKEASLELHQFGEIRNVSKKMTYYIESEEALLPGDVVRVRLAESTDGASYDIVSIEKPEIVNGDPTESNGNPSSAGGRWLAVDGETYYYSYTSCGNIEDDLVFVPTSSDEVDVYFDEYGYALGYSAVVPGAKYLYVEEKGAFNLSSGLVRVTLEDGTEKTITVSEIGNSSVSQSNWGQIPAGAVSDDRSDENVTEADSVNTAATTALLTNRIFGYVELSDGTYRLTTSIREESEEKESDGGDVYGGRPYQVNGVLPGMEKYDDDTIYSNYYSYLNDGTANEIVGVQSSTDGNFFYTPREDSMFIYESVNSDLNFKITSGNARVTVNGSSNVAFLTDNSTVFIDVVNGGTWIGYSNVGTIGGDSDSDLNMQVVFGKNGYADYVFINSGISADSGNYVIFQDNNRRWFTNDDGADMYEYTVYDLNKNEEVFIYSKDVELTDWADNDIQRNDLYRIASQTTDSEGRTMVKPNDIQHYYGLDQFGESQYGTTSVANDAPMGAAYTVGDGTFMLDTDEWFDKTSLNLHGSLYQEDGARFDITSAKYIDGVLYNATEENSRYFTVDSSTQIVKLVANDAAAESIEKFTISEGSLSDIKTVDQKGTTWVDVVSADSSNVAQVVLVIRPFGYDDVSSGSQDQEFDLSSCPVDVWRMNHRTDAEESTEFENGTGLSYTDAARLAGYINVENYLVTNPTTGVRELPSNIKTRDIVYRIAEAYATGDATVSEDSGLQYDPSTLEMSIVDYGTEYNVTKTDEAMEWIIKITGQVKTNTGNLVDSEHYVSFYFGAEDYSGTFVKDNAVDRVHVVGLSDKFTLENELNKAEVTIDGGTVWLTEETTKALLEKVAGNLSDMITVKVLDDVAFNGVTRVEYSYETASIIYSYNVKELYTGGNSGSMNYAGLNTFNVTLGQTANTSSSELEDYGYGTKAEPYYLVSKDSPNLSLSEDQVSALLLTLGEYADYKDDKASLAAALVSSYLYWEDGVRIADEDQFVVEHMEGTFGSGYQVIKQTAEEDKDGNVTYKTDANSTYYFVLDDTLDFEDGIVGSSVALEEAADLLGGTELTLNAADREALRDKVDELLEAAGLGGLTIKVYELNHTEGSAYVVLSNGENTREIEFTFTVDADADDETTADGIAPGEYGYTGFTSSDWEATWCSDNNWFKLGLKNYTFTGEEAEGYEDMTSSKIAEAMVYSWFADEFGEPESISTYGDGIVYVTAQGGNKITYKVDLIDIVIPMSEGQVEAAAVETQEEVTKAIQDNYLDEATTWTGAITSLEAELAYTAGARDAAIELTSEFVYFGDVDAGKYDDAAAIKAILEGYAVAMGGEVNAGVDNRGENAIKVTKNNVVYTITLPNANFTSEEVTFDEVLEEAEIFDALADLGVSVSGDTATMKVEEEDKPSYTSFESVTFGTMNLKTEADSDLELPNALGDVLIASVDAEVVADSKIDLDVIAGEAATVAARGAARSVDGLTFLTIEGDVVEDPSKVGKSTVSVSYYALATYLTADGSVFQLVIEVNVILEEYTEYKVTFDTNAGAFTDATFGNGLTTGSNGLITLPTATDITKTGYTLVGWNTLSDGTGTTFISTDKHTANNKLYAIWTPDFTDSVTGLTGKTIDFDDWNDKTLTQLEAFITASEYVSNSDTVSLYADITGTNEAAVEAGDVWVQLKRDNVEHNTRVKITLSSGS